MGWVKKTVKKTTKSVKKVAKTVTKVVKTVAKPIVKVVKKVAKSIVKVGKKIVSGIKGAVKSVGKTLGKLGPLASMALMAIPGLQPFAAGMWSSMGVTGALAQQALTSAAVGFVTSGGDLKAAALAGVGAYAGGALMGGAKSAWNGGSFAEGVSGAVNQAGVSSFQAGMDAASKSWGNFTDNVSNFFSSNSPTGDVANGVSNYTNTFDKYGMSPTEYMETYGKVPDTVVGATEATLKMDPTEAMAKTQAGQITEQAKILAEQNAAFGVDGVDNLKDAYMQTTPTELAAGPLSGAPLSVQDQFNKTMKSMGITPGSEQAKMLAEQQFGEAMPDMTKNASGQWNYTPYDTTGDLAFTEAADFASLAESGKGGTPEYIAKDYKQPTDLSSLLDSTTPGVGAQPFVFNDPGKGISLTSAGGGAGGTGGALGFTQQQRELQARLIAQAEAQAEVARKRAQGGWGLV